MTATTDLLEIVDKIHQYAQRHDMNSIQAATDVFNYLLDDDDLPHDNSDTVLP